MPDAIQFSVTMKPDKTFKIVVQDEKQIIRFYELDAIDISMAIINDEIRQLRPIHD